MDAETLTQALLKSDSRLPEGLAVTIVDHALARPMSAYISAEDLIAATVAAGTESRLRIWVERHGQGAIERIQAHLSQSDQALGSLAPVVSQERVVEAFKATELRRLEGALQYVDGALLRELLAPVFQDFLLRFVATLPSALGIGNAEAVAGTAGGLLGRLGKEVGQGGGKRILDMGRSVMGGLGLDLEERMRSVAKDFSAGATDAFREALERRLQSAEGQGLIGEIRRTAVERVLATPLRDVVNAAAGLPLPTLLAEAPTLAEHNTREPLGRALVEAEARAWYAAESDRTLGDWLQDVGVLDALRAQVTSRLGAHLRDLFATDAFATWLQRWLAEAGPIK